MGDGLFRGWEREVKMSLHTREEESVSPCIWAGLANLMSNTIWQKLCSGGRALSSLVEFDRPLRALSL